MKTNKKRLSTVLTAIMVLSICTLIPAIAADVSVIRDLPDTPVSPGEEFEVSLTQSGFFFLGTVTETLPEGFTYVPDSLTGNASATFNATTNNLTIDFEVETIVTYTTEAGTAEQIEYAVFSGTYKTLGGGLNQITGGVVEGDTTVTLAEPTPMSVFDTGSGTYPSISGIHNGTLTPNQAITVSKIYTYPCPGTGGHSEYVRLWDSGLDVNAAWAGYRDDWHNITFDEPFTLKANFTYNYTIRTGSYPQIIHAKEFNATSGEITCGEFMDANGKRYGDWIPAIRLE